MSSMQFTGRRLPGRPPPIVPTGSRSGLPLAGRPLSPALRALVARGLRFAGVGSLCGLVQLAAFVALERLGLGALAANVTAYLLSAQLNFYLSDVFIWGDRRLRRSAGSLAPRWLSFHLSIAGTFLLNQVVFLAARAVVPDVVASAVGIALSALANFAIQDRLTFRAGRGRPYPTQPR